MGGKEGMTNGRQRKVKERMLVVRGFVGGGAIVGYIGPGKEGKGSGIKKRGLRRVLGTT